MVFDPGLTVVVGPNGSGKSNVSDAILWVLGEQSAHMLRGQAMEDVIFSGSFARSAVGLAEVTLVLDNSDHTLPVDFSEVAITRRMYRSGESEYLINNSNARLMDIQDILHDSGLGKDTHSIISQGKLDTILSSRPEQRRVLIEEAAGISKHQRRRERSLRRLKRMDENLVRAKDIQKMITRQLRPLERQMRSAREGRELKGQLELLETRLLVDQLRDLRLQWGQCQQQLSQAEAQLSLAKGHLDSSQKQLREAAGELQRRERTSQDLSSRRERFQNVTTRLESILRIMAEKESHLEEKLAEIRQNQESYRQFQHDLVATKVDLTEDLTRLSQSEVSALEQVQKLAPQVEELRQRYEEAARKLSQKRSQLTDSQRSLDAYTLKSSQASQQKDQAEAILNQLQQELVVLVDNRQHVYDQREDFLIRVEQLDRKACELKDADQRKREDLQQAAERLSFSQSELQAASRALTHAQARLEGLKSADRQIVAGNPLAQVLAEDGRGHIQAHLADLIQVPAHLEAVFENYLGVRLAALLVDSDSDLVVLSHLAAESSAAGQALLYALDPLKNSSEAGADQHQPDFAFAQAERQAILNVAPDACFLADQVSVDETYQALVERLFARSLLVDDVHQALAVQAEVGQCTCITKDRELVDADGCVILGQADTTPSGVLERKRQIRNLEAGMAELKHQVEAALRNKDKASSTLDRLKQEAAAISDQLATTKSSLINQNMEEKRCQRDLERLDREERQLKAKLGAAQIQKDEAENQLQGLEVQIKEKTQDLKTLVQEVTQLEVLPAQLQESQQEKFRQLTANQLELTKIQERLRHVRQRLEDLDIRQIQQAQKLQAWQAAEAKVCYQKRSLQPVAASFSQLEQGATACRRQLEAEGHKAKEACSQEQHVVSDLRRQVGAAHNRISQLESQVNDKKVRLGRLEVQVQNNIQAIRDSSSLGLEEALQLEPVKDREAASLQVTRYRERLRVLGPINEIAVEQFQELKAKSDYISTQVDDLIAARKSLARINSAIERKMRKQFLDTFKTVDENFQEVFSILFPGGSAHLELLDSDRPEESGLEIVAQPKGKRITKMMLLSGGEKSLTALALLFAVYKTRTVPFYVFDEVEAALDASNLDKLLYAIEQLKKTTQLIVISHQRRTMEQADVLYGISMHADGVSHVVSQRLDKTIGKVVDA